MNRIAWSDDERVEYDVIVAQAWASSTNQSERTDSFLERLRDAEQAQRPFASDVLADSERRGAAALLKSAVKAQSAAVVSHEGRLLTKPRMIGTQRRDADGRPYFAQTLFDVMTWDEIFAKRRQYLAQVDSYTTDVAVMDKLIALHELAPAATNPRTAAAALGTTVDVWLGEEAA